MNVYPYKDGLFTQTLFMNTRPPHGQPPHTPAEVAKMLGVKTSTVYAWLSRKEMRGTKIGHRRFITDQEIREFFLQRRNGEYIDYTYAHGPVKN